MPRLPLFLSIEAAPYKDARNDMDVLAVGPTDGPHVAGNRAGLFPGHAPSARANYSERRLMARRRSGLIDDLVFISTRLPWWVGVALALVSYVILHGMASVAPVAIKPGDFTSAMTVPLMRALAAIGQIVLPLALLVGAGASAYGRWKRNHLHDHAAQDRAGTAVADLSWQEFELLVGEAFRRHGYQVHEHGGSTPDGGVDLVLSKHGKRYLVQCKHWKAWNVGVKVVRELYGVVAAENADGGFVVTSGSFSRDAHAFTDGKHISLLDGAQLQAFIHGTPPIMTQSKLGLVVPERVYGGSTRRRTSRPSRLGATIAIFVIAFAVFYVANRFIQQSLHSLSTSIQTRKPHAAVQPRNMPTVAPQPPAQAARLARRRAREAAFEAQYQPPKGCENWATDRAMVRCANHYIDAKRAFLAAGPE